MTSPDTSPEPEPQPVPPGRLNVPTFNDVADLPDLPIPPDTANLREGPDLHPLCTALLPLVGVWRGEGEVVYPTIDGPLHFGQQIEFAHDGRPFLTYSARAWLLDGPGGAVVRPAARETGWWRPQEDDTIEVLIAHATGIVEVYYGQPRTTTSWELVTDAVVRTQTAKEVNTAQRLYGLVDGTDAGRDLAYVDERAMVGQPLQPHLSARLKRIVG
ncbi:FABP family protein [Pseudonocardia acaciae]|uniref:FABP family protein n=1 Tax=Pseudonocardia acaciae TaxID=551276 RepID=UPI00048D5C1D|nr:FABP family protein [Pseudonocardia acaciae]